MKNAYIFAGVDGPPAFAASTAECRFFEPTGGVQGTHKLGGFCFMGGIRRWHKRISKARTRGRSKLAKCSPKERSTLPRGPITPRVSFQTNERGVTLGLSIDAQYATQWKKEGRSRPESALLNLLTNPKRSAISRL